MRGFVAFALSGLLAAPASAQTFGQIRRGSLGAELPIEGRAQPYNTWPGFAPFDGRVQSVLVLPGQWVSKDETLVVLVDKELAAMMESEPTTPPEVVAKRWGVVYRPAEVRCPFEHGYVVNVMVRSRQSVRSGDPLLSVAPSLKLTTPVPAGSTTGLTQGSEAVLWTKQHPEDTVRGSVLEVKELTKDKETGREQPAEVTVLIPPGAQGIDSGAELEGKVLFQRQGILKIPSSAVSIIDGKKFATVELRVGADNGEEAELLTLLPEGTSVVLPEHPAPKRERKTMRPRRDVTPKDLPKKEEPVEDVR